MNRYVLKFRKEGYIKYTSHLDLLRLFSRSFRMTDIELKHSEGFNPHPKMSFVQPLSLGYSSACELFEFETVEHFELDEILRRLNSVFPKGVFAESCYEYNEKNTLASLVDAAGYRVIIPFCGDSESADKLVKEYLSQEEINTVKVSKKNGKSKTVNIKPMIRDIKDEVRDGALVLDLLLDSGSYSNLSPELVITTFLESTRLDEKRYNIEVERTGIYFSSNFHF